MNLQTFGDNLKVLANLNILNIHAIHAYIKQCHTLLADELNQPTSFPTARSNKKIRKTRNPIKPPKNQWVELF